MTEKIIRECDNCKTDISNLFHFKLSWTGNSAFVLDFCSANCVNLWSERHKIDDRKESFS